MKCDDTFLFVDNTITELRRRSTTKRLYCGLMMYNHKLIHNEVSKWKDFKWDLSIRYTPFAWGGCYILSKDLVQLVMKQSHHLRIHHLEDVAVGLWLAPFAYKRYSNDLFCYFPQHCPKRFHLVFLFYKVSDEKLEWIFNTLSKRILSGQVMSDFYNLWELQVLCICVYYVAS